MINIDINQSQNRRQNNRVTRTLDEELEAIRNGTFQDDDEEERTSGYYLPKENGKQNLDELDYYLAGLHDLNMPAPQPQSEGEYTEGHLSGIPRGVANYVGAGVDFFGDVIFDNATIWGTAAAGALTPTAKQLTKWGEAIPEVTIFGKNGWFEVSPSKDEERPLKDTSHGWLSPQAQQEISKEMEKRIWTSILAETPAYLGAKWNEGMDALDYWINGTDKSFIDRVTHGGGTATGFGGASAMVRGGIEKLIDGLPPLSPKVMILKAIAKTLEAGTEAGSFIIDQYSKDPTILTDPDKLIGTAKVAGMNFAANAIPDMVLDAAGDFVGGKLPVKGLMPKFAKGMFGEVVKENIQEAYQTATERATEKTFKSGDLSIGNFWNNLKGEYNNILNPYTDEQGNQHSGYLWEQLPEVSASTLLSTGVMTAIGWPSPKQRGHIFTKKGREQMRFMSDLKDWNNRSPEEIAEDNEKFRKTQYDDLVAQRDKLQNEINQAYESLRNSSTETGENVSDEITRAAEIADLEKKLNYINNEIANVYGSQSDVISNPVQDDVMSLFPDADTINQVTTTSTPDMDTTQETTTALAQDTQQPQNIPPIYVDDTAAHEADTQSEPLATVMGANVDTITAPNANATGTNSTGNIQNNEPDLIADIRNDNDISPMDMLFGNNNSQGNTTDTQQNNLPEDFVDEIDDEPDADLEDDYFEYYNQLINTDYNQSNSDSNNDEDQNIGTFIFGSNSKDYSFNVWATSDKVTESIYSGTTVASQRKSRWMGRYIEIRNKRGKRLAIFTPYLGGHFSLFPDFASRHSPRWRQAFERSFRANLHTYLNNGGFLNEQGNLKPDGNEDFRKRWSKRIDENGYDGFSDYFMHPEDYDTLAIDTLKVSYQNADGLEVTKELSVVPGEFGDNMPEHKRYFGSYFDIKDEYGSVIARYAPRVGRVKFTAYKEARYMKQAVAEQLRRKANSLMRKARLLDANGHLLPDLNEEYRANRQAAHDIPNAFQNIQNVQQDTQTNPQSQGIQSENQTAQQQGTQGITPFGQQNNAIPQQDNNTQLPNAQGINTLGQQENAIPNQQQQQIKPKGRKAQLSDAISSVGNRVDAGLGNNQSETYNQQAENDENQQSFINRTVNFLTGLLGRNNDSTSNAPNTQNAQTNNNTRTIKVTGTDGKEHTLTARRKSFDGKYSQAKQYHGDYVEFSDENGRVIARWSPYSRQFQMANVQDADILQPQIVRILNSYMNDYLRDFGYLDEYGRLVDDGNKEFRRKYRARQNTTPEGKAEHSDNLNTEPKKKRKDTRSWKQRWNDYKEEKKKYEQTRQKVKETIYSGLRKILWDGKIPSEYSSEIQKKTKRAKSQRERIEILDKYVENLAEAYSHVITARIAAAAHLAGMSVEDYHKLWKLRIQPDIMARADTRGYVDFQPARTEKDKNGKEIFHEAETIIHLTQLHNESTILHEFAHIFLRDYQDLIASVDDLPAKVKKDWLYLTRWLGISDIDPKSTKATRTDEENARMQNAQEKFAVAFEQYYMTGKAPKSRLQRVFNYFKDWLSSVYRAVQEIRYAGSDGRMHEVELSPEVKRIFGRMLKGSNYYIPSTESSRARIERTNNPQHGEEFHNQTASGQDNQLSIGRQNSIRDVINAMQTEQGRENAGRIWVDYARVSPEEAKRLSDITGLDISHKYVHTITGEAVIHALSRHGEDSNQRQDQLPITNADLERIP